MNTNMTKADVRELRRKALIEKGMSFKASLSMDYECEDLGEEEIIVIDEDGNIE